MPIFIGGCVRYFADIWSAWKQKRRDGLSLQDLRNSIPIPVRVCYLRPGLLPVAVSRAMVANSLNLDFDRMLLVLRDQCNAGARQSEKYFEEHLYKPMANLVNVSGDMCQ